MMEDAIAGTLITLAAVAAFTNLGTAVANQITKITGHPWIAVVAGWLPPVAIAAKRHL
jgi:hypothetical protein